MHFQNYLTLYGLHQFCVMIQLIMKWYYIWITPWLILMDGRDNHHSEGSKKDGQLTAKFYPRIWYAFLIDCVSHIETIYLFINLIYAYRTTSASLQKCRHSIWWLTLALPAYQLKLQDTKRPHIIANNSKNKHGAHLRQCAACRAFGHRSSKKWPCRHKPEKRHLHIPAPACEPKIPRVLNPKARHLAFLPAWQAPIA